MKTAIISILILSLITIGVGIYFLKNGRVELVRPKADEIELSQCYYAYAPDTISLIRATTYNPVASQCDSNPLHTADGSYIDLDRLKSKKIRWCALSSDLLKVFDYGDTIEVYSEKHKQINGYWVVHDCMAKRWELSIDFLMLPEQNYPKLGIGKDVKILHYKNK